LKNIVITWNDGTSSSFSGVANLGFSHDKGYTGVDLSKVKSVNSESDSPKFGQVIYVRDNLNTDWMCRYFKCFDSEGLAVTFVNGNDSTPTVAWKYWKYCE
jgi:hypothetical protein